MLRNYNGTQRKHLGKNHVDFCRGAFNYREDFFNDSYSQEWNQYTSEESNVRNLMPIRFACSFPVRTVFSDKLRL